jgi:alpha-tubulin suppressor-like RCC1 family protein
MTRTARRSALSAALLVASLLAAVPSASGQDAAPAAPAEVGTANWRQVSAGNVHACGIRTTGRMYCWGSDSFGRLGNGGTDANRTTPVQVAGNATNWSSVSVGWSHACALRTTGGLYCWGENGFGELGINSSSTTFRNVPTAVGTATDWVQVSAGEFHTCARKANHRLFCWGRDLTGEVGNGGTNDNAILAPVQVAGRFTDWTAVSLGRNHSCGRRSINSGTLFCWGLNSLGELGNGGVGSTQPVPNQVIAAPGTRWTAVSAGEFHTCGRQSTGRLYCWGHDVSGQLGNGLPNDQESTPSPVGTRTDWTTFSADGFNTCARRASGRLFCWGENNQGQLGNNDATATDRSAPVQVSGNRTDWGAPNVGESFTCAVRTTRRLYCWGNDSVGQLGNGGANTNRLVPTQVAA